MEKRNLQTKLQTSQLDFTKALMCFAVIFYHCVLIWRGGWFQDAKSPSVIFAFLASYLQSFHIYTFVFVSGFLHCYLRVEKGKYLNQKESILRRANRLLLPYLIISVFWVVPFEIFFHKPSVGEIVKDYVFAASPSQLWFLVMLFVVFCFFNLFFDFIHKARFSFMIVVFLLLYGIGVVLSGFIPDWFQLLTGMQMAFFYYLGFAFRKYGFQKLYRVPWLIWFFTHLALVLLIQLFLLDKGGLLGLLRIPLFLLSQIAGVIMIVTGIAKIGTERIKKIEGNRLFRFFEENSFLLYLFHQQAVFISVSLLNGVLPNVLLLLANLLFAVVIPSIIVLILKQFSATRKIFGIK